MSAESLLRDGRLDEALSALQDQVRNDPSDAKQRIFLFQLLSVLGQWNRALTQLNVAAELDASALAMAQMYREVLRCEVLRAEVFAGQRTPVIFGEPSEWIALLLQALQATAQQQPQRAAELRAQAFEAAPAVAGQVDEQPFQWLADGDTRLGPVFEAVINGRYYWIPMGNVQQIDLEAPTDLRDLVWTPAHFVWTNGGDAVGVIPTRYPDSESQSASELRLARTTAWQEIAEGAFLGSGQRIWITDVGEFPILDVKTLTFATTGAEAGDAP